MGIAANLGRRLYPATVALFPSRYELPELLNRRGLLGCGVEVGVRTGAFSERLLSEWKGVHLISVDPWREVSHEEHQDSTNVSQDMHERLYDEARARLSAFGDRSSIWRTTSTEAAGLIPDGSLDFVYLDARHDYASVMEDLAAWFPKVRPGGVIGGHDYLDVVLPEGVFEVSRAVDRFFGERGIPVSVTFHDAPWETWLVERPIPGASGRSNAVRVASVARTGLGFLRSLRLRYEARSR